jgi:signal transduction histidine kinase
MFHLRSWIRPSLWLGLSWSLLWSLLLSNLSPIQSLDLQQQDALTRLRRHRTPPNNIALVTFSAAEIQAWRLTQDPTAYATLVQRLLDAGAQGVILNLLPHWIPTSDHPDNPIKSLIKTAPSRIVLVLPTTHAHPRSPTFCWRCYELFLPASDPRNPSYQPQSLLGFFESEPEAQDPRSLSSTARQVQLVSQFRPNGPSSQTIQLEAAALLALRKFLPNSSVQPPTSPVQLNFWGPTGSFPTLPAASVLAQPLSPPPVRDKIVLVGFSDVGNPEAFALRSPFGDLMPAVEVQANLLASLMTGAYYRLVPLGWQFILIVLGGLGLSRWLVYGVLHPEARKTYPYWLWPMGGLAGLGLLSLGLWSLGWIWPIALPLAVWMATGASVVISLRLGLQQDLIAQQQCELDRLHNIEQTAILAQVQKALRRLAAHIHEGPLQELKLVMDRLELLQTNGTRSELDPVLDQLTRLGHHLRQQLNQARAISLEITPLLKRGLAAGIDTKLNQLIATGQLTLQVIRHLHPLNEPLTSSRWLAAREDIYQIFVEAITNVIRHAQPPHGTATQVKVRLGQTGSRCELTVENDGDVLDPAVLQPPRFGPGPGKYGLQLMQTLAADLPEGQLTRTALETGGLRITLSWILAYTS